MKRLFILLLILALTLSALPACAGEDDSEEIFNRGIAAYSAGDYATALEAFTICKDRGLVIGYYCLGVLYAYGQGVEQSYSKAAEYLKVSAEYDHPESLYLLGFMHLNGVGVEQSQELAVKYLQKAADLGDEAARTLLDSMPQEGDSDLSIPEQLRKRAAYVGLQLPEPTGKERLYVGAVRIPETTATELWISLIASPNLMQLHSVTVFGYGLEVKQEGAEPHLIVTALSSADGEVICRNAVTGAAGFTFGGESSIENLTLDEDGGSCSVTMAGSYEQERDGMEGVYAVSATVTLYNLTGSTAMDPLDPPTAEQLRAAGMNLPETAEGETLFIGQAGISQAKTAYFAFVRTADGEQIRNFTYLILDLELEYYTDKAKVRQTSSTYSGTLLNAVSVSEDLSFGSMRIGEFAMDEDSASGVLRISYSNDSQGVKYPLDPARILFVKAE